MKLNTEEFIFKAKIIHGDKYLYPKTNYNGAHSRLIVTCPIHGDFTIIATNHLSGRGCPKCTKHYKRNTEEWIDEAKSIHGIFYDYSKTEYINNHTKVCIICPIHGEFRQLPSEHLKGKGCPVCEDKVYDRNSFILKSKRIHHNKYDYSKTEYVNYTTKTCIICPIHGEFWQTPGSHLSGKGCPICGNNTRKTRKEFIEMANKVHDCFYTYESVEYKNNGTKVTICCPTHGTFQQTPHAHLSGQGCPLCYAENKNLTETKIKETLSRNNILFEYQKRFKWLGRQSLDFYFPEYKSAIEYQGRQHFSDESYYFDKQKEIILNRDMRKIALCKEHGIKLYHLTKEGKYIPTDFNFYKLYLDIDDILKEMCHH